MFSMVGVECLGEWLSQCLSQWLSERLVSE